MTAAAFTPATEEPKGRRTVRRLASGNLFGYIGHTRWEPINGQGIDPYTAAEEKAAAAWIEGNLNWRDAAWA